MGKFLSFILTAVMTLVALSCIGVSGFASWQFWHQMAADPVNRYLMSTAAISLDAMRALLPVALAWGLVNRRLWHFQTGFVVWLCLVVFSFATAVGYISTQRTTATAGISSSNKQLQLVRKRVAEIETRISGYQGFDTAAKINADLASMRTHRRWTSSSSCTDATATKSRAFCAKYLTLLGTLATAISLESDRKRLDIARDTEAALMTAGAGRQANPQASTVAKLIPDFSEADAEISIRIAFAALIEACAALGLYFAFNHGGMPTRASISDAATITDAGALVTISDGSTKTQISQISDFSEGSKETRISQISDFRNIQLLLPDDARQLDEDGRLILRAM